MSMNATFVQVEPAELARFEADPSLVEALFAGGPTLPLAFANLGQKMQERVRTAGPQLLANALSNLDPTLRKQIEERLGRTQSALAAGKGGDAILKLMQERLSRGAQAGPSGRAVLSLDKDWHGVHFILCGAVEPGREPLSQAVLGGEILGEDDEGFSGYGPPRYFTAADVTELAQALSRSGLEAEAAARFNAARMTELDIYPGWEPSDASQLMERLRNLRDFFADASAKGRAIITCLV